MGRRRNEGATVARKRIDISHFRPLPSSQAGVRANIQDRARICTFAAFAPVAGGLS